MTKPSGPCGPASPSQAQPASASGGVQELLWELTGPPHREWPVAPRSKQEFDDLYLQTTPPLELKAAPGRCEEASYLSRERYIPCNAPAVQIIEHRGEGWYRMCAPCADHNVRRRGATLIGPYKAEDHE